MKWTVVIFSEPNITRFTYPLTASIILVASASSPYPMSIPANTLGLLLGCFGKRITVKRARVSARISRSIIMCLILSNPGVLFFGR